MNIFQIFKTRGAASGGSEGIEALARAAAREIATEAAREALVEPTAQLLQIMQSPDFARRGSSNVLAYNSDAYAMNDPRRFRDYADPRMRPYSTVNVDTLRTLARSYDVLASCITHLKSEVIKVPIKVVARDSQDDSSATAGALEAAKAFLGPRGGLGGSGVKRAEFEGRLLDDVLIIGAGALFLDYDTIGSMRDGSPDHVIAIDASTIRPLLTEHGFLPPDSLPAWEQVVQGQCVSQLSRSELIYEGLPIFAQTHTPYFLSAVELLVMTIFTALKCDEWNRTWLTDGNVPDRLIRAPKEWTPDQIREYTSYFDDLLAGDSRARHKVRVVPEGTSLTEQSRKDADFQQFEWWMRDRTCSVMGVNPASIGHHSRQYQSSQSAAMDATSEGRVAQLLEWRRSVYDGILERKGWGFLQVVDDVPGEEDSRARVERHEIEIRSGLRTINETRREDGLEPSKAEGSDALLIGGSLKPLEQIAKPPSPAGDSRPQAFPAGSPEKEEETEEPSADATQRALKQWERKCVNRLARGKSAVCEFRCSDLAGGVVARITNGLAACESREDVIEVFARAGGGSGHLPHRAKTTSNPHNTAGSFAPDGGAGGVTGSNAEARSPRPVKSDSKLPPLVLPSPDHLVETNSELHEWFSQATEPVLQAAAAERIAELVGNRVSTEGRKRFRDWIHNWGWTKTTSKVSFSANLAVLQRAVAEEFDLPLHHLADRFQEYDLETMWSQRGDDMRVFFRGMYEYTQEALGEMGIQHLLLWRGIINPQCFESLPAQFGIFQDGVRLQPVNSFTMNVSEAYRFAGQEKGAVVAALVPVERILGTPVTGFGRSRHDELTVLGSHHDEAMWMLWDNSRQGAKCRRFSSADWASYLGRHGLLNKGAIMRSDQPSEEIPNFVDTSISELSDDDLRWVNDNWLCEAFWDEDGRYIGPGSTEEDRNAPPRPSPEERSRLAKLESIEGKKRLAQYREDLRNGRVDPSRDVDPFADD